MERRSVEPDTASTRAWHRASPFIDLPKLFGEAVATDAPYWKLNWTALVVVDGGQAELWASNGTRGSWTWSDSDGSKCTGPQSVPRRLTPATGQKAEEELYCLSPTEFILLRADGAREGFASPYSSSRIFLTDVVAANGVTLASLNYAQPRDATGALISGCPAAGTGQAPYLSSITGVSTHLDFRYASRTTADGPTCPLTEVWLGATAASATPVVRYAYQSAGVVSVAPLKRATRCHGGNALRTEGYSNVEQHLAVARVFSGTENVPGTDTPLRSTYAFSLPATGFFVESATSPGEAMAIDGGAFHRVGFLGLEAGDFSSTAVTREETHVLTSFPERGGLRRSTKTTTCSALQSCTPGTEVWNTTTFGSTAHAFSITPASGGARVTGSSPGPVQVDGGAATGWYSASSHAGVAPGVDLTGLNTPGNCKGLECEWYGWTRTANNQVKLSTTTRPSVVSAGNNVTTTYTYHPNGELKSVVEMGYTKGHSALSPDAGVASPLESVISRSVGTFHNTTPTETTGTCAGVAADTYGRIVETKGPCEANAGGTGCASTSFPLTHYVFYGSSAAESDRHRLMLVRRYPGGCSSTALVTSYGNYDAQGRPQSVTDPAGISTQFTLDADGHVLTKNHLQLDGQPHLDLPLRLRAAARGDAPRRQRDALLLHAQPGGADGHHVQPVQRGRGGGARRAHPRLQGQRRHRVHLHLERGGVEQLPRLDAAADAAQLLHGR